MARGTNPIDMNFAYFHSYASQSLASTHKISQADGMARLGDIIYALSQATGGLLTIAYQRYLSDSSSGDVFKLSETVDMLSALQSANICTEKEAEGIINDWPCRD